MQMTLGLPDFLWDAPTKMCCDHFPMAIMGRKSTSVTNADASFISSRESETRSLLQLTLRAAHKKQKALLHGAVFLSSVASPSLAADGCLARGKRCQLAHACGATFRQSARSPRGDYNMSGEFCKRIGARVGWHLEYEWRTERSYEARDKEGVRAH
jgi:hypothetical protein